MERSRNNFLLLFLGQAVEVDGITGNTDGQIRILFGMLGGIDEHIAVEDVDVDVLCALTEVAVDDLAEIAVSRFVVVTECLRNDAERVGDTVLADVVRQLCNGVEGCKRTGSITSVHRVRTGRKRLACTSAVGRVAGLLAVDDVGGDRQNRQRVFGIAVGRDRLECREELLNLFDSNGIRTVVVVAVLGEVARRFKVGDQTCFVTNDADIGIFDCRQRAARTDRPAAPNAI